MWRNFIKFLMTPDLHQLARNIDIERHDSDECYYQSRATLVWALFLEIFGFHNEIKISISTIKFHYFMWIFEYFISTELSMAEKKSWICNSRDQCWTYSISVFFPTCSNVTSITFIKYTWQWCQQFLPLKRLSTPIPCESSKTLLQRISISCLYELTK